MRFASRWATTDGLRVLAAGLCALALAGCGGGGSGGDSGSANGSAPSQPPPASVTIAPAANVAAITVGNSPAGTNSTVNVPYVSVTVCPPGSASACQTIDHVILDTGSSGLRIVASALPNRSALKQQVNGSNAPYAECAQFVSSFVWGSVKVADVVVSGLKASSIPVHVIGDPDFAAIPSSCSSVGVPTNTVASLSANGILGVGPFRQDCGNQCAAAAVQGAYYVCPSNATCTPSVAALNKQVANPVAFFPSDNNGVLIQLPALPASGARDVTGALVLGIGTRGNNALGSVQVFALNKFGNFTTTVGGRSYPDSFIDSGSNFLFFNSAVLTGCTGFGLSRLYCPSSTQTLTAVNQGTNGTNAQVSFSIANASTQFTASPQASAFNNIGGTFPVSTGFDWGLPFFYGRRVFTALEGASTPGGIGPYVAY